MNAVSIYCQNDNNNDISLGIKGWSRFLKNINYVIYFKGCFCPPHRGHFSAISDIVLNNPNVSTY